jgi:hypothetical protein
VVGKMNRIERALKPQVNAVTGALFGLKSMTTKYVRY